MDELTMLGAALAEPDPSPDTIDRSRHRLQNVMRGGPAKARRKKPWIAAGAGLMATAATAAVIAVVGDNPSTPDPKKEPVLSGQQVILAAATAAESQPASSGTYWHTKLIMHVGKKTIVRETWIRRDGRTWLSTAPGVVSRTGRESMVEFTRLDYADIQRLPTDPERLKAALFKSSTIPSARDNKQLTIMNALQAVLGEAPAPPKVRAAAYRALAAMPSITNLGRTAGGYRLKISYGTPTHVDGTETIVVDPKTTQLRVDGWAGFGDGGLPVGPSQRNSGWTDRIPGRIVPKS
jgi:hypothetical protein